MAVTRAPRQYRHKPKPCSFCTKKSDRPPMIDYKDIGLLRKFVSDRGKIRPRRVTGNCRQHQRDVAVAIKNAREVALLPYSSPGGERPGRPTRTAPSTDAAPRPESAGDERPGRPTRTAPSTDAAPRPKTIGVATPRTPAAVPTPPGPQARARPATNG